MSVQCIEIRELLSPYIDGHVTPTERSLVEDHLPECSNCSRELATLRETVALLQRMPQVAVRRSFTLEAPRRQPMALFAFLRAGSALATAVFLVVLTLDVVRSGVLPVGIAGLSAPPIASEVSTEAPTALQDTSRKAASAPSDGPPAAAPNPQATSREQRGSEEAGSAAAPAPPVSAASQPQEMRPAAPEATPQSQGVSPAEADSAPVRPEIGHLAPAGLPLEPPPSAGSTDQNGPVSGPAQPESTLRVVEAAALGIAVVLGIGALWLKRQTGSTNTRRRQRS